MAELFDTYDKNFEKVVQSSIDFSGLEHEFVVVAKADIMREVLADRMPDTSAPHLLDVGCGVGAFHPYTRGLFGKVTGVDVSPASVAEARRRNPHVAYETYDGDHLPYPDATFDVTLATCVVHHVVPERWPAFIAEMRRVVRPGGLVCVIEHNPLNPLTQLAVARCEFDRDAVLLRSGTTQRLMRDAGLKEPESRFFLMLPSAKGLARRIERLSQRLPIGAQYLASGVV